MHITFAGNIKMKERNAAICFYLQCYQDQDPTYLSGRFCWATKFKILQRNEADLQRPACKAPLALSPPSSGPPSNRPQEGRGGHRDARLPKYTTCKLGPGGNCWEAGLHTWDFYNSSEWIPQNQGKITRCHIYSCPHRDVGSNTSNLWANKKTYF